MHLLFRDANIGSKIEILTICHENLSQFNTLSPVVNGC